MSDQSTSPPSYAERLHNISMLTPSCHFRVDYPIISVHEFIESFGVNMDPDYQRDYVWSRWQKQKFIGAVLQNSSSIPILWYNFINDFKSEVVDGKQRLSAIIGWLKNEYEALCPCGERFWFKEADKIALRRLRTITLKMHFVRLSRIEAMKFYLALNSGGTVHNEKDLDRVRNKILTESIITAKESH